MNDWKKNKISFVDIEERILQPRFLLLLNTFQDQFVALRIQRQHLTTMLYDFVKDGGDLPLAPVTTTGTAGVTQSFLSPHNIVAINELSITDGMAIPKPRIDNLMQIFYGISPSYLFVSPEQPGGTLVSQLPESAEAVQINFPYIFDHSGFDSPLYAPSKYTELFSIANVNLQFTLVNSVPITINPKLMFVMNNLLVEPITSVDLFRKMLEGTVPRRVVTLGQIYSGITWSPSVYSGIKPVAASSILGSNAQAAFTKAGYPSGGD